MDGFGSGTDAQCYPSSPAVQPAQPPDCIDYIILSSMSVLVPPNISGDLQGQ